MGMAAVHAGTADDPWCKKCINRGQNEVETSLLHCFYGCPSSKMLITATIGYFSKDNIFPEAKQLIMSTKTPVFNNLPKSDLGAQLSSLITDKILYYIVMVYCKQTLPSPTKLIQIIVCDLATILRNRPHSKISKLLKSIQLSHYTEYLIPTPT